MTVTLISENGKNFVKAFEGLAKVGKDGLVHAYRCPAGRWTIGYGSTKGVRSGMKITKEEADALFDKEAEEFSREVAKLVKVPVSQAQFDALVSLAFNIGVGAFSSSSALRELNKKNYDAVPDRILLWNKITVDGKKVVSPGLHRRRAAEASMFTSDAPLGASLMPQKVEAASPRPLAQSRTVKAGAGALSALSALSATEVLTEIDIAKQYLEPITQYSDIINSFFIGLTVLGVGVMLWARYDDWKQGIR